MSQPESSSLDTPLPQKRATTFQVVMAVAWSFLGIRKWQSYENDVTSITPIQAVIGGIIGVLLFITAVIILVNLAIHYLS
jgi:Protein of unknown function (DUF2970)